MGFKMKQKINVRLIFIAVVAIIATSISITLCCYASLKKQVKNDLRVSAKLLGIVDKDVIKKGELSSDDLRITLIEPDGTVIYDNDVSASVLENHHDRPEVLQALENGVGESVRLSDTMNTNTFYYCVRQNDGTLIRVSTKTRSMLSVFISIFPVMGLIIAVIVCVCIFLSNILTRQLLEPIEDTVNNLENSTSVPEYKELVPFVNMIRKQHEDILAAVKSRQDFTANVSHELKTPLTAISGYAELIENHMVEPNQETHFAKEIKRNADRLVTLINDIIRLSELDNDTAQRGFEQVDLYQVVSECMEPLEENARQKGVKIRFQGTNCMMFGNKEMLAELVENLCQNAIRYNVPGGTVDVNVLKNGDKITLTVKDSGIGIPKEEQERVFERFYRVDKSRSSKTGGTGLGLAIVKHIVTLHDARITLDSDVGKGTTINVEF